MIAAYFAVLIAFLIGSALALAAVYVIRCAEFEEYWNVSRARHATEIFWAYPPSNWRKVSERSTTVVFGDDGVPHVTRKSETECEYLTLPDALPKAVRVRDHRSDVLGYFGAGESIASRTRPKLMLTCMCGTWLRAADAQRCAECGATPIII